MTMPKTSVIKDDAPFYFRFFKVNLLFTKFYSFIVFAPFSNYTPTCTNLFIVIPLIKSVLQSDNPPPS